MFGGISKRLYARNTSTLLLSFIIFILTPLETRAENNFPKLFMSHSDLWDRQCSQMANITIDPIWVEELTSRVSEFQAVWDEQAPIILGTLVNELGMGFSRRELTATFTLCKMPSLSHPLFLNMRRYLKSFRGETLVYPVSGFISLVFHELLHTFVDENLRNTTPLLRKYSSETQLVRNHLHVMALQKWVYLLLNRPEDLQWLSFWYGEIGGDYARSWEIIDQKEDHLDFVAEFLREGVVSTPSGIENTNNPNDPNNSTSLRFD